MVRTFPRPAMHAAAALAFWYAAPATAQSPGGQFDAAIARATDHIRKDPAAVFADVAAAEKVARRERSGEDLTVALAAAERLRGEALLRLDRPKEAAPVIEHALASIASIPRPLKQRGDLLLSRGAVNAVNGAVAAALADFQAAFRIFDQIGEARGKALALSSIAWIYREAEDYTNALKYYAQAAEAYQGDPVLLVSTETNRGTTLQDLGRFDEAEQEFRKALALARSMNNPSLESLILRNQARGLLKAGRLAEADRAIAAGFALAQGSDGAAARSQLYAIAAQAALQRDDLARARTLIEHSFAGVDLTTTSVPQRAAHDTAYQIFSRLGDSRDALRHLEALKRLDDKTTALAASTNTALMSARFNSANQEVQIANLKAADEQSQKRFLLGVIAATAILIGLLSLGLVTQRRSRIRLAASNKALEKALAAKTEFLATTSHEIRTPLNGILGMTQVMRADSTLAPATRERIDVVHSAGVTMRALVDDLLDVAKMETGRLTVETAPVELGVVLGEVARMWRDQAAAKGLTFTLDLAGAPALIEGDAGRLRQIVFNLLSNAIKFTEHGEVALSATTGQGPAGERLRIAVRDTGIGIDPDQHEVIFESFRQADGGTTRKFGGTGLGLTICRNLAQAMGGEVRVASAMREGATFTLDLPLVRLAPPAAAAGLDRRVLVVDSNPITRAMLRALLEKRAAGTAAVNSLAEAADSALTAGTTVLIDESAMNGVDDLVSALERLSSAGVRVLVLTRAIAGEIEQVLARLGAEVIRKPIAGAALSDIVLGSTADAIVSELVSEAA